MQSRLMTAHSINQTLIKTVTVIVDYIIVHNRLNKISNLLGHIISIIWNTLKSTKLPPLEKSHCTFITVVNRNLGKMLHVLQLHLTIQKVTNAALSLNHLINNGN